MERIFDVTLAVIGPLIVVALVALGLICLLVVRRLILPRLKISEVDSDFAGAMVQGILVFYGLALALLAVNVLESYSDVSKVVSNEATSLATLYHDVSGYPEPTRSVLRENIRAYVENVIKEAWPLQAQGKVPTRGVEITTQLQETLMRFQPQGASQEILHGETLAACNRMIDARRHRLDSVNGGLPGIMWFVILFGALISLLSTCFFNVDVKLHAILVSLLAVFIGVVIFMILALDRPFRGDLGVSSAPYQLIYDQLMKN